MNSGIVIGLCAGLWLSWISGSVHAAATANFDFSDAGLAAQHPEILLAPRIVAAMQDVAPLALRLDTRDGLPTGWLNGEWQFLPLPGEPEAIARNRLFVPSLLAEDFAIKEAYAPAPKAWYKATKVWYSVNVDLPADWRDGPLVLHFGAVDFLGAIFVNGHHVATHVSRYTPFEVPLAAADVVGGRINISVFVLKCPYAIENGISWFQLGSSYKMDVPPGGITAPVCLYRDTPAGIRHVRVVTTVSPNILRIACETQGPGTGLAIAPVIVDAAGREVLTLPQQPAAATNRWETPWQDPVLWSDANPYVYHVRFDLYRGETRLPTPLVTRFGFRQVQVKGRQILLNGIPVKLWGVSIGEQGVSAFGRADEDFNYRLFRILKERFHINALRFHHNPASEAQIRAADRAGMLVINQSGVWTSGRDFNYRGGEDTLRNLEREFGEWMWRDMNSPSTIIWDTANEYILGSPGFADYWRQFDAIARRIDPTRIIEQSGSGLFDDRGETCHIHTGYYSNARAHRGVPARYDKPVIFGEFLSPKDLQMPRWIFSEGAYNDEYIKTFEDRLSEYRLSGAAGVFPFYSLEDAFTLDPVVPADQVFAPASFNPQRFFDSYIVNPYHNVDAQIDPRFTAMADRVFAPVAALWRERSQVFEAGRAAHRTLRVANDSPAAIDAMVTVTLGPAEIHRARLPLQPGDARDLDVTIPADARSGALVAKVAYGTNLYVNATAGTVLAPPAPVRTGGKVFVCGGTPGLAAALAGLGYAVERLRDVTQYEEGLLVVGEDAVTEPGKLQTVLDRKRGQVIVLRQENAEFAAFSGLDYVTTEDNPRDPDARLARAGLYAPTYDRTLFDRGVANYDNPGGTDAAYFDTYAVPLHNGLTPPNVTIVFGGSRPHHTPCLRYAMSGGNILFCQLHLEAHLDDDVRAKLILQRLVELAGVREQQGVGAIYTDHPATRDALRAYGFQTSDDPTAAKLAVVSHAAYDKDPRLAAHKHVLIYGAVDGTLDGRPVQAAPLIGFITFLVSPDVPGLGQLASANFFRIVDGTINKEGGYKTPVPVLTLADSERAVFGKTNKTRMRVFAEPSNQTILAHYLKDGGDRWVYGFDASESCVLATTLSIARWLELPFTLDAPRRVQDYYVVGAGDVALDGDLTEWRFDGDQAVHNWRQAMALHFGTANAASTFYSMEDSSNLYVALAAPATRPLAIQCGRVRVSLAPKADGTLDVQVDGHPSQGHGVWRENGGRSVIEAAIPHLELNLGQKSQVRLDDGVSGYPAGGGTFCLRMKQPRYSGDCPAGGEATGSGQTKLEVHVGQATVRTVAASHARFTQAAHVAITESPKKGWKIQLLTRNDLQPIKKGDLLLAVVYARCATPEGHLQTSLRLGLNQDAIAEVPIDIGGTPWRRIYARARANRDYGVDNCVLSLAIGSANAGQYEFANMQIMNYGADFDAEGVPASGSGN